MNDQLRKALDEVGGEPLAGSGFEKELPEPEFSENGPSITLPIPHHWTPAHIVNFRKVWNDVLSSDGKKIIIFPSALN